MCSVIVNFDYESHFRVVEKLIKKIDISYMIGYRLPPKNSNLSKVKYLDIYPLFDKKFKEKKKYNKEIKFNKIEKGLFYQTLDRVSNFEYSTVEKNLFFKNHVNFWINFFIENKVKFLLFAEVPHLTWDFSLYLVAKKMNIKIIIIKKSSLLNINYLCSDINPNIKNIINLKNKINLEERYYNSDFGFNFYKKKISSKKKGKYDFLNKNILIIIQSLYNLLYHLFSDIPKQSKTLSHNSYSFSTFASKKKGINRLNYTAYVFNCFLRKITNRIYNNFQNKKIIFNKKKKYIFFPLHFQPERTTLPEGWRYSDQLSAIKILSKSLPLNWQIIVKEHPRQLSFDLRNYHYRDLNFYRKLKSIPRVIYLSSDANYDEILKKCDVTATITGSVCTEGIFLNKPSVIFGQTWLMNVKKIIHLYKNVNELKKFLNNCIKISSQTFNLEIQNFFKHKNSFFYEGSTFDGYWNFFNEKTKKKLVNSTAKVLENVINQK